jgi:hypothetical protein
VIIIVPLTKRVAVPLVPSNNPRPASGAANEA